MCTGYILGKHNKHKDSYKASLKALRGKKYRPLNLWNQDNRTLDWLQDNSEKLETKSYNNGSKNLRINKSRI